MVVGRQPHRWMHIGQYRCVRIDVGRALNRPWRAVMMMMLQHDHESRYDASRQVQLRCSAQNLFERHWQRCSSLTARVPMALYTTETVIWVELTGREQLEMSLVDVYGRCCARPRHQQRSTSCLRCPRPKCECVLAADLDPPQIGRRGPLRAIGGRG